MSRKLTEAESKNPLHSLLEEALKHLRDPAWLGEQSALANAYFLGEALLKRDGDAAIMPFVRGQVLQSVLQQAIERLADQGEEGLYEQRLIQLSYLQSGLTRLDILNALGLSKSKYHRDRAQAIAHLAQIVVQSLNPAQRLEHPVYPPNFIGRGEMVSASLESLHKKQSIGLSGASGVGKTTLAAYLIEQAAAPSFFFTFRIGFNDHLNSLFFALGYFFHQQGISGLWVHLVAAKEDHIDQEVVLGLIRHALAQLEERRPILCFDEVDLLHGDEIEAHAQLLSFLESLRHLTSLIFVGHRIPFDVDLSQNLTGLAPAEIKQLLDSAQVLLAYAGLMKLHSYTNGNPRLVELFIALYKSGEPLEALFEEQIESPTIERLLNRILTRLDATERRMLATLSVYRRSIPDNFWQIGGQWDEREASITLQRLFELHLISRDNLNNVLLLQAYQKVIYQHVLNQDRELFHIEAAKVRSAHFEYTAAAYHYIQAGEPERAVWLWYEHQQQEINQGQGQSALTLFQNISTRNFDQQSKEALSLIYSNLQILAGQQEEAQNTLSSTLWETPILTMDVYNLERYIANQQSDYNRAKHLFHQGLKIAESMIEGRLSCFHKDLGWIHRVEQNWQEAWRESQLARYEVDNFQGRLCTDQGTFLEAESYCLSALETAQKVGHTEGEAKTCFNLGEIYMKQGRFEKANSYFHRANQSYEQIGDFSALAAFKVNLATNYNLAEQYEAAIPYAESSLDMFTKMDIPRGIAVAAQTLAESYLAVENLEQAEGLVERVFQTEETERIPDALRVLGEIRLKQENFAEAERYFNQSIEQSQQNQDRFLEAYAWRVLAQCYLRQNRLEETQEAKMNAIHLFQEINLPNEIEKTEKIAPRAQQCSSSRRYFDSAKEGLKVSNSYSWHHKVSNSYS